MESAYIRKLVKVVSSSFLELEWTVGLLNESTEAKNDLKESRRVARYGVQQKRFHGVQMGTGESVGVGIGAIWCIPALTTLQTALTHFVNFTHIDNMIIVKVWPNFRLGAFLKMMLHLKWVKT